MEAAAIRKVVEGIAHSMAVAPVAVVGAAGVAELPAVTAAVLLIRPEQRQHRSPPVLSF